MQCEKCGEDSKGKPLCYPCWKAENPGVVSKPKREFPPKKSEIDHDSRNREIRRMSALKSAIEFINGRAEETKKDSPVTPEGVLLLATTFDKWIGSS